MTAMWQLQYLRALEIGASLVAEADRERLVRSAARSPRGDRVSVVRRGIAVGARSIERAATSVAAWADPRTA
jgi:hypothetical protein